jgi:hypothetical protein
MRTPDLNPKPEVLAFSTQHLTEKGRTEQCSHYKSEGHSQERCWVLHPHLKPKRSERNQAEVAKKKGFVKTLEEERKGISIDKRRARRTKKKGLSKVSSGSSQSDSLAKHNGGYASFSFEQSIWYNFFT